MGFLVTSNLRNMRLTLLYELIDVFSRSLNRCEKLLLQLLYQNCLFPLWVFLCIFKLDGQENATLQFSQKIGFLLWMKSLMFLQVTWTCVAFSTCYTTVLFLSSVFSHVPSSHLYVTRSCHTACNRVAILQYGSPSGSSCDQTMRKTWPRFCTWMTSHLCEFFYVSPILLLLQSIFDTSFFCHCVGHLMSP